MIIGRKHEIKLLEKAYNSKEAEFITIYGRRRVGKTFLIREFYSKKKCTFLHATGIKGGNLKMQLKQFIDVVANLFFDGAKLETPKSWNEAFDLLNKQIIKSEKKIVIFLDELPWLATKKSGLLEQLDYYWNRYWTGMPQIILIVCGSSASWIIKKIIYNKAGLHNRTTCQIKLNPFTLKETSDYFISRSIKLNEKHVLSIYMALGGIPYYLRYVEPGLSAEQNIQRIIFDDKAPLKDEYDKLFDSLFENADAYKELVKLISKKSGGIERSELIAAATLSNRGGRLSQRLNDLSLTGFIEENTPWGKMRGEYYRVIDEFCLFYLHWVRRNKGKKFDRNYWINQSQRPAYYAWSGYAFEAICGKHINQIIDALDIRASSTVGSWRYVPKKKSDDDGAQIDLIIDRTDNVINLCELKYTEKAFAIDKHYYEKLKNVIKIFQQKANIDKQIFLSMISANGLKKTIYSEEIVNSIVTLKDLFKED